MDLLGRLPASLRQLQQPAVARAAASLVLLIAAGGLFLIVQRTSPAPEAAGRTSRDSETTAITQNRVNGPADDARDAGRRRSDAEDRSHPPDTWAETWEAANSALGQFSPTRQRDDAREIARAKLTSRLLNELPDIERADVVWDREERRGWNRPPQVRATVYLKPRDGRAVTLETVHAVRLAVAGSKAYLDPEDVVVMDLDRMVAYDADALGGDFDDRYRQAARLTALYRQQVDAALSDVPGALAAVSVRPADVQGFAPEEAGAPRQPAEPVTTTALRVAEPSTAGGPNVGLRVTQAPDEPPDAATGSAEVAPPSAPTAAHVVEVSVTIPTSHYRQVGIARGLLPAADSEQLRRALSEIEREVAAAVVDRLHGILANDSAAAPVISVNSLAMDGPASAEQLVRPPAPASSATISNLMPPLRITLAGLTALLIGWMVLLRRRNAEPLEPACSNADVDPPPPVPPNPASEAAAPDTPMLPDADRTPEIPRDVLSSIRRARAGEVISRSIGRPPEIDDLANLPESRLRELVQSVPMDVWPAALSAAAPATRNRLLSVLPEETAPQLRETLGRRRPVRLHEIERAQQTVLSALGASGEPPA